MLSRIILLTLLIACSGASQARRCKKSGNWYACNKAKDGSVECEVHVNRTDQSPMAASWVPGENKEDPLVSFNYRCIRHFGYLKFSFEFCSIDSHVRFFKELPNSGKTSSWYECRHEDGSMICKVHLSPYSSNGIYSTITERDWYQCFQNGPQVDCFIRPFQHLDEENCAAVKRGCRPGASKNINGYWCMCGYDGLTYQCPPKRISSDFKGCQSERCASGSVWREGKYVCTCSEEFLPHCHVSNETLIRDVNYNCPQKSRICNPGDVFQYESKTCTCQETGMFALCKSSNITKRESGKSPHICLADNRFIQGEKDCVCLDDSRSGLCVSNKPVGLICSPERLYMDDCNLCLCSSDGRSALCTVRHCADAEEPVKRHTLHKSTKGPLAEENLWTGIPDASKEP